MAKKDKNKTEVQGQLPLENSTDETPKNGAAERAEKALKASIEQQAKAQAEKEAKQKEDEARLQKAQEERDAKKKANEEKKAQAQAEYDSALESARDTAQEKLENRVVGKAGLGGLLSGIFTESPEEKEKREAGLKERQEAQKQDIKDFKDETEKVIEDTREASESDAEKNIASLENILKERLEGAKNDPIYNELPRTIRQAYKAKEFGDPMNEDIRKAYREEMRKPKKERNADVIADYKKELERTKDARNAKNWYTMNAIGTGLMNFGSALKGGGPIAETEWNKRQGARMEAAQQRYKDLLDTKANALIEEVKNKQGYDQATQKAIRSLYNDKRLQPVLNKLDTDSQIQLIDLMQKKSGAINFNAFVNALVLSLMDNPQGAVSGALGLGKDFVDFIK